MKNDKGTTTEATTRASDEALDGLATIALSEFCSRASARQKAVELIAGFHADESAAGRSRDTEDNYNTRFAAFAAKPVL